MFHLSRHAPRRAFTLMEIMVALLIFGAAMAAIATVIHTSVRAWRAGHAVSEITQAAHAAQDVISRDLQNLYYMSEPNYNKAFRRQLMTLASQLDQESGAGGDRRPRRQKNGGGIGFKSRHAQERAAGMHASGSPEGDFGLADMSPPIDLSFHGAGGESGGGELSFARLQPARWEGDPETGGIRRIKYYIKDNTLFREETDPYGFRPGMAFTVDGGNEKLDSLLALTQLFMTDDESKEAAGATPELAEQATQAIPVRVNYSEPLCANVTKMNFKFGYFRDGQWQETSDWDSGQIRYRHYIDPEEFESPSGMNQVAGNLTASQQMKKARSRLPDDLPGYIKISFSVVPEGKGREHEYSFMYSVHQAQEDDIFDQDRASSAGGDVHEATQLGSVPGDGAAPPDGAGDSGRSGRTGHSSRYNQQGSRYNRASPSGNNSYAASGNGFPGNMSGDSPDTGAPGWGWNTETRY